MNLSNYDIFYSTVLLFSTHPYTYIRSTLKKMWENDAHNALKLWRPNGCQTQLMLTERQSRVLNDHLTRLVAYGTCGIHNDEIS